MSRHLGTHLHFHMTHRRCTLYNKQDRLLAVTNSAAGLLHQAKELPHSALVQVACTFAAMHLSA